MEKRYQVFLSSTYADLKEERQQVLQTLMEMDCIPAGMELFPATDEEQWEFIKKIIDDCDYYLLIIGGRYGSLSDDGISYTEKEYRYAVKKGIKVIAFLHGTPTDISVSKTDIDPKLKEKLDKFRDSVAEGRLVKFWKHANELPGLVALSLTKAIKMHPAVGWIRASNQSSAELLNEVNELRKENISLRQSLKNLESMPKHVLPNLADYTETFEMTGTYYTQYGGRKYAWRAEAMWGDIFGAIAPYLLSNPSDTIVKSKIAQYAFSKSESCDVAPKDLSLNDQVFQTIKTQFLALGLVEVKLLPTTNGGRALFWNSTESGQAMMFKLRTVASRSTPIQQ